MTNELQLVVKESGLEQSKVETLLSSFGEYFQKAKVITENSRGIVVTSEDQIVEMAEARKARLSLWKIRCEVENTRKELKEQSLREGKAIDGISNVIKALIIPVEEHLEKQEKFAELAEAKRKAERFAKRIESLSQYVEDVTLYSLSEMSEEAFTKLLEDSRKAVEAQKAAAKKAEEERLAKEKADAEEREKMRLENEKLRAEREIQEKKLAEERRRVEIERQKQEEILRKEREEKARLEKELADKKEAEEKIKMDEEEKERQKLLAPDKNKLLSLVEEIEKIKLPTVQSKKAQATVQDIAGMIGRLKIFIEQRANNL